MKPSFYQPATTVTGPAYSPWFKMLATLFTTAVTAYGISFSMRFSLHDYGWSVIALMLTALILLLVSFCGFLYSTVTIDEKGIKQTWVINRQVQWPDIRGAKMIGIPRAGWLSPPRLVVRTGTAFYTFNGGTQALLTEFARISLAFEMKK
jgi:hypothetical protein